MLNYPQIDPVALAIGPLKIHWYGLMYLIGFAFTWIVGKKRAERQDAPITPAAVEDMVYYAALGVILGGRVGYVLFYNFSQFLHDPLMLIKIWQGGMSFHGGMLGVFIAMWIFAKKNQCTMFALTDFIAPMSPIGLLAGRIGNFINSELWGKVSDVPWAMVFPNGGALARHPSQLYEAFLEGVVLYILLALYTRKKRPTMSVTGMAIMTYGIFRFIVEFFRVPDAHLGYLVLEWVTMGQILSLPMILGGAALIYWAYAKKS